MTTITKIEWAEMSWNPLRGCSRVSEGCRNCYAERMAARFSGPGQPYEGLVGRALLKGKWTGSLRLIEKALTGKDSPLHRRKPTRYFVNSMSDLFHENVPDAWIDRILAVVALCPQHTFMTLTKRAKRMREYMDDFATCQTRIAPQDVKRSMAMVMPIVGYSQRIGKLKLEYEAIAASFLEIPLPNLLLGVSAENQATADERIPELLATPAAVRFVSLEPLLRGVDLRRICIIEGNPDYPKHGGGIWWDALAVESYPGRGMRPAIDWIIAGGESGPGARPMHPDWARSVRDQCQAAGVPFFFKQWGEWGPDTVYARGAPDAQIDRNGKMRSKKDGWAVPVGFEFDGACLLDRVGKKAAGALLDGREWGELPFDKLRTRPEVGR